MSKSLLKEFKEWRKQEGLPFNAQFTPKEFDGLADLEEQYAANEAADEEETKDAEARRSESLAILNSYPRQRKTASPGQYITRTHLNKQLNKTCEVIGKAIGQLVRPELAKLEKRIAELEASPTKYVGVWTAGTKYPARSMVTHSGGIWHANEETTTKPGTSDAWTLAVKRGRDGRETAR